MSLAIETRDLAKSYGPTRALDGLSLRVDPGQCFGFLGPNGAGKTTTIRMLLALQHPSGGSAEIFGHDVQRESVEIHRRIGYLPADLVLYRHMSGRQHIDWFARARGQRNLEFAMQLAERFEVELDRPAGRLSTGNRQKVGLVLAFMSRPELLILDEPTSGLDPLMQAEFERLIRDTIADGRTVFLSSHELDEVQRLARRVAIIRDGRLVADDTIEHLRAAAPQRIEVQFAATVGAEVFSGLVGVTVASSDGPRLVLDVRGPIGPILRAIAEHDPVDLVSQHAGLDELFLTYYRQEPAREAVHAG